MGGCLYRLKIAYGPTVNLVEIPNFNPANLYKFSRMKWMFLNESPAAVRLFNLVDNNSVKEVLRYHSTQQSVRVSCRNRQRVYFIEQAGFRNSQYVFKNEYGFETGVLYRDNAPGNNGCLDTGKIKIEYAFQQKPLPELVLYEEDGLRPKLICALQPSMVDKETIKVFGAEHACLLWGLYWYLHDSGEHEELAENKTALAGYL
jgi:hypothetical protein